MKKKNFFFQIPYHKRNEENIKVIICKLEQYNEVQKLNLDIYLKVENYSPFPIKITSHQNNLNKGTCTSKEFYISKTKLT